MSRYERKMKDGRDLSFGWDWLSGFWAHIHDTSAESKINPSGLVVEVGGEQVQHTSQHLLPDQLVTELADFVGALKELGIELSPETLARLRVDKEVRGLDPTPLQENVLRMGLIWRPGERPVGQ